MITRKKIIFLLLLLFFVLFPPGFAFAQLQTKSAIKTTRVGNPQVSTGANFAIDLVSKINAACGDSVNSSNIGCLDTIKPSLDSTVLQQLKSSATTYQYLQCVGFVQAIVVGTTGQLFDHGGDAINFATNVPTGYQFIRKSNGVIIQEGDIPIKNYDTFGHMMYVTKVYDQNNFQVAEANFGNATGGVHLINKTVDDSLIIGWLRKQ